MATRIHPWSTRPRGGRDSLKAGNFLHGRQIIESTVEEDNTWNEETHLYDRTEGKIELTLRGGDRIIFIPGVETADQIKAQKVE